MAKKTVEIECDDQTGQCQVGLIPEQVEGADQNNEQAEADYMKPAASVDEALAMAKQLLSGAGGEEEAAKAAVERDFTGGFNKAQPAGPQAPAQQAPQRQGGY